uniref:Uncharacterized protein n=1 Tax=Amorphochlora amoebiformis TaxID=1561963 RepID=A0A7S0DW35_9EUKA|mmetsp:Transcript_8923/g.14072  ORF Transcript_8923/g.14072 Transcript_8923/m.14072 type:complete len:311 (+) Transcript_8923:245-1177(+)
MDVLYALLVSDAIARLTSRQEKLQERAIIDSTHLSNIVRGMKAVFRQLQEPQHPTTRKKRVEWQKNDDETTKHQILEHGSKVLLYVWEYTDVLIFGNRLCELRDILYEDPLTKMEEAVEKLQKLGPPDSQAFRKYERMQESIETLRFTRLQRLDNEGEALPSGIKTMMDTLSVYILLSYIFLSSARELEPTLLQIFSISSGIVKASDLLSHVFSSIGNFFHLNAEATCFAVLASWLLVVRNLIRDLESPFDGAVHLRRMVITNSIFSIRRDVEFALRDMDLCSVWDQAQRSSQDSVKRLTSIEEVTQKKS